jgi:hypothetical protein
MRYLALVTIIKKTGMIDCTLSTFVHGCGIVKVSKWGIGWPPHDIASHRRIRRNRGRCPDELFYWLRWPSLSL